MSIFVKNKNMLVYIALVRDLELTCDEVINVQTDKNELFKYVKEYYGISDINYYDNPSEYLGYTKIEYSEYEDDLEGYMTFKDKDEIEKVYIFCKELNQKI